MTRAGELPLHLACEGGAQLKVIEAMIKAHPSGVSTRDLRGRLPIHAACISGTTVPVLEELLRILPESAEMRDSGGRTPLQHAEQSFHKNRDDLVEALSGGSSALETGCTTLFELVSGRMWDEVVARAKEAPEEASTWSYDSRHGLRRLPIHLACSLQPPRRVIASLINAHPDGVTTLERDGRTCLHTACQNGACIDMVRLLVNSNPEAVSTRDYCGLLPIQLACSHGAGLRVVKLLLWASPQAVAADEECGGGLFTALEYSQKKCSSMYELIESVLAEMPSEGASQSRQLLSVRSLDGLSEWKERSMSDSVYKDVGLDEAPPQDVTPNGMGTRRKTYVWIEMLDKTKQDNPSMFSSISVVSV
eukprot:CAMPEP_0183305550 /NCGR_PEP_ID=MMETSP0160_2-20130417/10252_1 /TAXON_ID=2839 ORGANISM="Odontella Sinensis, Strain Grunow 1884" /NCGR_SAMPLE_ID=MMETSP0160_2 /ASSEMBLY_ACC=CAM_ASM_000250 /LENGTH=362 /DNA_ID=CAMNT_0025468761 /DNA_START=44 /DNA_END=1132 /DNA_ORIENTATION=+